MLYHQDVVDILNRIELPNGWKVGLMRKGDGFLIQIRFYARDSETGVPEEQRCRKWYISSHATTTEVVRTVYKAGLAALEHEFSETFKYRGVAVYHPHRSIELQAAATNAAPFFFDRRPHDDGTVTS